MARMDDRQHILEQQALRNVRTLVERLDRADREGRKRDYKAIGAITVVAVVLVGAIAFAMRKPAYDPDEQRQRGCELDAFNVRAATFERSMRDANPDMPYRDIQKRLERERAAMVVAAKAECSAKAR